MAVNRALCEAAFAMGCFWGVERIFRKLGIEETAVGYCGGHSTDPDYHSVCTGETGHAEAIWMAYDQELCDYRLLLKTFWEGHDPTQGNRQGNDVGSQYRSIIFTTSDGQRILAEKSRELYVAALAKVSFPRGITTSIEPLPRFTRAETGHQRYLERNPLGYCGLGGTGIELPPLP